MKIASGAIPSVTDTSSDVQCKTSDTFIKIIVAICSAAVQHWTELIVKTVSDVLENVEHCGGELERADTGTLCP